MENYNFAADERMKAFAETAVTFRLPRWEQLPTLELYMDQVVTVIERSLEPVLGFYGEAFITSSMVNNYVKLGMVRKPERKKYGREHIACLIVITVLKQSLSIGDIRLGIDSVLQCGSPAKAYDSFCDYVERGIGTVASSLLSREDTAEVHFRFEADDTMITMAACSFASRIFTAKMLSILRENAAEREGEC